MELGAAGLQEQPFRTHGKPLVFVNYAGQRAAIDFLNSTYDNLRGLGLFLGPSLSGKTTILRQFVDDMDPDVSVAVVDGSGLNTSALLEAILGQYGYRLDYDSASELINMLKVFAMQQTVEEDLGDNDQDACIGIDPSIACHEPYVVRMESPLDCFLLQLMELLFG